MHRVLTAVGVIPPEDIEAAAGSLYANGFYEANLAYLTLCCVGGKKNPAIAKRFPCVPQLLWSGIAGFIYRRFNEYFNQKLSHPQWDCTGQTLRKLYEGSRSVEEFSCSVVQGLTTEKGIIPSHELEPQEAPRLVVASEV